MEVHVPHWRGVGDSRSNGNKEQQGNEDQVEQNVSMLHLLLYVAWQRVSVRDILSENREQWLLTIG
jgi:hypothetical protein